MRYKNNVLDRLNQVDAITNRISLQVSKNMTQEQLLESVEKLLVAIAVGLLGLSVSDLDLEK